MALDPLDHRIRDEFAHHLEERAREFERDGMTPEEARRAAAAAFGDVDRVRQASRSSLGPGWTEGDRRRLGPGERLRRLVNPFHHALRTLLRRPGYAATAVLTLVLGIATTTSVFALLNGLLLNPLPFPQPDALVTVWGSSPERPRRSASPADFLDWRAQSTSFTSLAGYSTAARNLLPGPEGGSPERVVAATVSAAFFRTLGVDAATGRAFDDSEFALGEERSAVLSDGLWRRRWGGDPGIVGTTARLDAEVVRIVGVAPPGFEFPSGAQLWMKALRDVPEIQAALSGEFDHTLMRDAWYFNVVGRLRDDVSLESARTEMERLGRQLAEAHPEIEGFGIALVPLRDLVTEDVRGTLILLMSAVGVLLLIACTNVANLVLARGAERRREFAVRAALGAGRRQLAGSVWAEITVLVLVGGMLGTGLATLVLGGGIPGLSGLFPRAAAVGPTGTLWSFAAAVTLLTGMLCGALPALFAGRAWASSALGDRSGTDSGGAARLREGLVVGQLALAVVLVLGAGLLLRSARNLAAVDPGFDPTPLAVLPFSIPGAQSLPEAELSDRYRAIIERVSGVAGVRRAALATRGPLDTGPQAGLRVESAAASDEAAQSVGWQRAGVGYFEVTGIPILRGRAFDRGDGPDSEPVAIVNEALVGRYFADRDPLGERINTGLDGRPGEVWVTIVGVAADTRNRGPVEAVLPAYYRPLEQSARGPLSGVTLLVQAENDPGALLGAVRQATWESEPQATFFAPRAGGELTAGFSRNVRAVLSLLGLFAGSALLLGAVGIYGVTAFAVSRRTREIGIRMALGAQRAGILRLVLGRGLTLAAAGSVVGLVAAAAAARLLRGFLFGVHPADPLTGALVVCTLAVAALVATLVPAARAARVDPGRAMRPE